MAPTSYLQSALENNDVATRLQTAIKIEAIAEPFIKRKAFRHFDKGRFVFFGAGSGNPYFTTDTAAALRATELGAEILIKGTKVDGVYSDDPRNNPKATKYGRLSYDEVLEKKLEVMDLTAICLCRDHKMPIKVFNMQRPGSLFDNISGLSGGTLIH